jgi:hypothetical protein
MKSITDISEKIAEIKIEPENKIGKVKNKK